MSEKRIKTDMLLINPPFSLPDKPYISIPTLAAYLKTKGVSIQGIDANIEFWRYLLSPGNLEASKIFAEERLSELNDKKELNFAEMVEYSRLVDALNEIMKVENKLSALFIPYIFSNVEKFSLFSSALKLASVPYFPEVIEFVDETGYLGYTSKYSPFFSQAILESLTDTKTLYSQYFETEFPLLLQRYETSLVGISLTFPEQVLPAFKCAYIIKQLWPNIHVVVGGTFVSCHMRQLSNRDLFKVVDSFILDDGEIPLELLRKELSFSAPNLGNIPGLMYISDKKIVQNFPAIPVDMDSLPAPDYSIFPLDRYLIKRSSMALLFRLSRGCYWGKCTFCRTELSLIHSYSQPSVEHIFEQLQTIIAQTGVKIFHFSDDAPSPELIEALCKKIIESQIKIKWVAQFRFDKRLTVERLKLYKKAGCHTINLGLESYTPRVLKLMRKGISEPLIEKVLTNLSIAGIPAVVYMIVGFPTETENEAKTSYQKILNLKQQGLIKRSIYSPFRIVPYSPINSEPDKFGITKIYVEDDTDLMPPITYFETKEGMNRDQAFRLYTHCINDPSRTSQKSKPQDTKTIKTLIINDKRVCLNFSLDKIQEKIIEVSLDKLKDKIHVTNFSNKGLSSDIQRKENLWKRQRL